MHSTYKPLQHILLVDDNPVDRRLVIHEISREFDDVEIHELANLNDLKAAIANLDFDLVITDYELNWSNGIEVLHHVKNRDPMMPVVMFTDSGSQEIAVKAMKAGLDDYVLKSPKHLIRLSQAVRAAWENSQIRRRADELDIRQRFLLNQLEVGVFRASLDGSLLEVNDGFLQLLGLTSFEEGKQFFHQNFEFDAVERVSTERNKWEQQLHCPDGRVIWVQVSEAVIQQNGGQVIDGLMSDITEKKESEIALQQFNKQLEARVRERTAQLEATNQQLLDTNSELELLAYSMSHDLQAPIRQISGFATLLQSELAAVAVSEAGQGFLRRILRLTEQAGRMIIDLLEYSRTGRNEMQWIELDMARLVNAVLQQLQTENAAREIVWQVSKLPTVVGDFSMLERVWQNLLDNAVKYTQQRERAEIVIDYQDDGSTWTFSVQDNGAGFDEQYGDQVFTLFQRLHTDDEFEGTGIGLANVKRIIHRHGGRVWARGEVDCGATFYFSLPKRTA